MMSEFHDIILVIKFLILITYVLLFLDSGTAEAPTAMQIDEPESKKGLAASAVSSNPSKSLACSLQNTQMQCKSSECWSPPLADREALHSSLVAQLNLNARLPLLFEACKCAKREASAIPDVSKPPAAQQPGIPQPIILTTPGLLFKKVRERLQATARDHPLCQRFRNFLQNGICRNCHHGYVSQTEANLQTLPDEALQPRVELPLLPESVDFGVSHKPGTDMKDDVEILTVAGPFKKEVFTHAHLPPADIAIPGTFKQIMVMPADFVEDDQPYNPGTSPRVILDLDIANPKFGSNSNEKRFIRTTSSFSFRRAKGIDDLNDPVHSIRFLGNTRENIGNHVRIGISSFRLNKTTTKLERVSCCALRPQQEQKDRSVCSKLNRCRTINGALSETTEDECLVYVITIQSHLEIVRHELSFKEIKTKSLVTEKSQTFVICGPWYSFLNSVPNSARSNASVNSMPTSDGNRNARETPDESVDDQTDDDSDSDGQELFLFPTGFSSSYAASSNHSLSSSSTEVRSTMHADSTMDSLQNQSNNGRDVRLEASSSGSTNEDRTLHWGSEHSQNLPSHATSLASTIASSSSFYPAASVYSAPTVNGNDSPSEVGNGSELRMTSPLPPNEGDGLSSPVLGTPHSFPADEPPKKRTRANQSLESTVVANHSESSFPPIRHLMPDMEQQVTLPAAAQVEAAHLDARVRPPDPSFHASQQMNGEFYQNSSLHFDPQIEPLNQTNSGAASEASQLESAHWQYEPEMSQRSPPYQLAPQHLTIEGQMIEEGARAFSDVTAAVTEARARSFDPPVPMDDELPQNLSHLQFDSQIEPLLANGQTNSEPSSHMLEASPRDSPHEQTAQRSSPCPGCFNPLCYDCNAFVKSFLNDE